MSYTPSTLQDRALTLLYEQPLGQIVLRLLVCPPFSRAVGWCMDSSASRLLIPLCIHHWKLNMGDYTHQRYHCYNDFFTRRVRSDRRPMPIDPQALACPCDGLATVLSIGRDSVFTIKGAKYTLKSILRSDKLATQFAGGLAIILRLTVSNYHRYCYPVSGVKSVNRKIPGKLHTTCPIAHQHVALYHENSREYTALVSPDYGTLLQMEVGALCVGRIVNYHESQPILRGQEKGRFEFGGSTVILFLQKNRLSLSQKLLDSHASGLETPVRMGETLGLPLQTH
ncbi:MAG: phosphatidylserine decarboxylase [Oscillospiraceae bacterium]